jgi:hypothetical protein
MNDPREQRLPRWAQQELAHLRSQLKTAQTNLREAYGARPGATAVVNPYDEARPVAWGPYDTIRFTTDGSPYDPERDQPYIDVRFTDSALRVQASSMLIVRPWASNVAHISVEERTR